MEICMMSRVLTILQEMDKITGGMVRVSGSQIQYIGNDGSLLIMDFRQNILDLLRGGTSSVVVRSREGGY